MFAIQLSLRGRLYRRCRVWFAQTCLNDTHATSVIEKKTKVLSLKELFSTSTSGTKHLAGEYQMCLSDTTACHPNYPVTACSLTPPLALSLLRLLSHCSACSFTAPLALSLLRLLSHSSACSLTPPLALSLLLLLSHSSACSLAPPLALSLLLVLPLLFSSSSTT